MMVAWTKVVGMHMREAGGEMSQLKQEKQAQRKTEQKVTEWELTVERTLGDHSGPTPYFLHMRKPHNKRAKPIAHHLRTMTSL